MFTSRQTKIKLLLIILSAGVLILSAIFLNHKKPTADIISPQVKANELNKNCTENLDKQNCYRQEFISLAKNQGFEFSVKALKALQSQEPELRQCHGLAHAISVSAVRSKPDSWLKLIGKADISMEGCAGGFLHGIIEGHLAYDPDFTVDSEAIKNICGNLPPLSKSACAHGFGHILVLQSEDDLKLVSAICEKTEGLASECYNGMFMENSFKDMLIEHEIVKTHSSPASDPKSFTKVQELCSSFDEQPTPSYACWSNLGHIIAEFYQHDQTRSFAACELALPARSKRGCYFRAVSSLVVNKNFAEAAEKLTLCSPYAQAADASALNNCVRYVVATLIYHSTDFLDQAVDYCSSVNLDQKLGCFEMLGFLLADKLKDKDLQNSCNKFPEDYIKNCLSPSKNVKVFAIF